MKKVLLTALLLSSSALAAQIKGADGVTVDITNPKRVVALNSTVFEMIYRLGKQNTIVGRDVTGSYPASKVPSVGHWAQLPAEGIIALKPDLVVTTADNAAVTPKNQAAIGQLRATGVKVLVLPRSDTGGLDGVKTRLNMLGQVYGVPNAAASLTKSFDTTMSAVAANRPKTAPRVIFLYAHNPNDVSIYGTDGGADDLITAAGGKNVAPFKEPKALTAEALVSINPDAIVMLQRGFDDVGGMEGLMKLPGVAQTTAGKNRHIYITDDSIRWIGPRFPEFALKLARAFKADFR